MESRRREAGATNSGGGEMSIQTARAIGLTMRPTIRRRRFCPGCNHKWTTIEIDAKAFDGLTMAGSKKDKANLIKACASISKLVERSKQLENELFDLITDIEVGA